MMSVNAPPPTLISRTPPSKVFSRLYLFLNVNCANGFEIGIIGESSRLSLTVAGSLMNAAFGAESATGTGNPEFEVTQSIASGSTALAATQSTGSAGGVTPSKFWLKTATGLEHGVGADVGSALEFDANKIAERDSRMTARTGYLIFIIFLCGVFLQEGKHHRRPS